MHIDAVGVGAQRFIDPGAYVAAAKIPGTLVKRTAIRTC